MATGIPTLVSEFVDEQAALDGLLASLEPGDWERPTPAPDWRVRDQVHHLAFFDAAAARAVTDPDAYAEESRALVERGAGWELDDGGATPGRVLLDAWRRAGATLAVALRSLSGERRLPWFGREMGAASFISARLMECWCHGQDVRDAVGVAPSVSPRLRHVADIGVRALPYAFAVNGLEPPDGPIRVEVTAPDGSRWTWGPPRAPGGLVRGTALDLCLIVTQRRHLADTGLAVTGAVATRWVTIAQAFAGPPGAGRSPGQFARLAQDGTHPASTRATGPVFNT